jgi:hypothetical protein
VIVEARKPPVRYVYVKVVRRIRESSDASDSAGLWPHVATHSYGQRTQGVASAHA